MTSTDLDRSGTGAKTPDLKALRCGDAPAWDEAFRWLWPAAFAAAQFKLQPFLPGDIEDVAIETLEELVEASQPELRAELERLRAESRLAKQVLPLVTAAQSATGEFPAYARERLQTKVRQTLGGREITSSKKAPWNWRWILGLATATALVILLLAPRFSRPASPSIELAMLDVTGTTRGSESVELKLLQQQWQKAPVHNFEKTGELEAWEKIWPGQNKPSIKVIYDRSAGEVRVLVRSDGRRLEKTFLVEKDVATALQQADAFIREQMKR